MFKYNNPDKLNNTNIAYTTDTMPGLVYLNDGYLNKNNNRLKRYKDNYIKKIV